MYLHSGWYDGYQFRRGRSGGNRSSHRHRNGASANLGIRKIWQLAYIGVKPVAESKDLAGLIHPLGNISADIGVAVVTSMVTTVLNLAVAIRWPRRNDRGNIVLSCYSADGKEAKKNPTLKLVGKSHLWWLGSPLKSRLDVVKQQSMGQDPREVRTRKKETQDPNLKYGEKYGFNAMGN